MSDAVEGMRQGTLDLLILKTLSLQPLYGWAISQRVQQLSRDVLELSQGSLYPALHRLEHNGLIEAEWLAAGNNRRTKVYRLTAAGKRRLAKETRSWERFAGAVQAILEAT